CFFFFFQAEDGIRDLIVTGVQTCALPILGRGRLALVVGDAVGHGIPAAGAMGRLRGALRSTTLRDPSPAAVLAGLDGVAAQMDRSEERRVGKEGGARWATGREQEDKRVMA